MKATIELLTQKSPPTTSKILSGLKAMGINLLNFTRKDAGDDQICLILVVETGDMPIEQLHDRLLTLEGSIDVVNDVTTRWNTPDDTSPTASLPEISRDLVDNLVDEYPVILSRLDRVEEVVGPEHQARYFMRLGTTVGKELSADYTILQTATTIDDALALGILPMLDGIAEGKASGTILKISKSIFTRSNLKDSTTISASKQCSFLAGLIQGLLNETANLSGVTVSETKCIDRGDACCHFEVK